MTSDSALTCQIEDAEDLISELMVNQGFHPNPYPVYHRLREIAPVYYSPRFSMWFVSSYSGNESVLNNLLLGQGDRASDNLKNPIYAESPTMNYIASFMVGIDPPDHTRLRKLVMPAFLGPRVNKFQDRIRRVTDRLLDEAAIKPKPDLHADFSSLLPMTVICTMLGIPDEYVKFCIKQANTVAEIVIVPAPTDEQLIAPDRAYRELEELVGKLIEDRRESPRDDYISFLVRIEEDGDRLTSNELTATIIQLMIAGSETTTTTIEQGIYQLIKHPDQLDILRDNPGLYPNAVEEILRYNAPIHFIMSRVALSDTEIEGTCIKKGAIVMLLPAAGNRDPARYEDPDNFDVQRNNIKQLSFGGGIHVCLGNMLARLETRVALKTIFERFPKISLDGEPPLRGAPASQMFSRLPVKLH